MAESFAFEPRAGRRVAAYVTLAVAAVAAAGTFVLAPAYRDLVGYGLYAIPSHLLISVLPNEPALFYVAKMFPPKLIASVGVTSATAAGILDYWLIGWFVNKGLVRSKLDAWRPYQIAQRIFRKAPFLLIAGSAFAPVPFYPVKILAIASDYSMPLFLVAAAIGRWPRFYLLAIGGQKVQAPNSALAWIGVALVAFGIFQIWRSQRGNAGQAPGGPSRD